MNDGVPSSLLTPVTPTVSQGSVARALSPKRTQPNSPLSEADDAERKQTASSNQSEWPSQNEKAADSTTAASVADSTPESM